MIPHCDKSDQSLTRLFESYRVACDREKHHGNNLVAEACLPESEMWFTYWNLERKLLYAEIVKRAEVITTDVLLYLIETGSGFTIIGEPRKA